MRDDHGGNVEQLARAAGRSADALLDFSASINPLGLSPAVEAAIREALSRIVHYPEPRAAPLVEALAAHHGMPVHAIVGGNGATELIYLVARASAPRRALVVHPAFSEYEAALEPLGCDVERLVATEAERFLPSLAALLDRLPSVGLVFLAHPGNPSGASVPAAWLEALAAACEAAGVVLAVDEAFIDFVEEASFKRATLRFPHLAVLRSLTKFFAVPGLRVGYAFLGEAVRASLERWREPWSVNALGVAAALAALDDVGYRKETERLVSLWREQLAEGLSVRGFRVFPSVANYLLARVPPTGPPGPVLRRALLAEGIAIRDCSLFLGLGTDYVRFAVRRSDEQRQLLGALDRALGR